MERMGLVRRIRPGRFGPLETAELLKRVLGGAVEASSAAAMHVQSEGVPFIVEELARTHREAGTLQQIEGEWRLGRNAARLVPSAVRTLIDRRAARLPPGTGQRSATRRSSAEASAFETLARSVCGWGGDRGRTSGAPVAVPAVARRPPARAPTSSQTTRARRRGGLLLTEPTGEAADYTFTHEQVGQFAANQLSAARRRQVHAAVVDLLLEGGDPTPAGLPMLAQHALAAGDTVRSARFSIKGRGGPQSNAPEEALRLVDQALPVVSSPARDGPSCHARRRVGRPSPDRRTARRTEGAGRSRRSDAGPGDRARRSAPACISTADEP